MTTHVGTLTQAAIAPSTPGARILVIDEDPAIRRLLRTMLTRQGYQVYDLSSMNGLFRALHQHRPDLLIIDPFLSHQDGTALIAELRARWSLLPILIVSEEKAERCIVNSLDAGADDYLMKPFGSGELAARIRAGLRHIVPATSVFTTGDLSVDLTRRVVTRNCQTIRLTAIEYDLLKTLIAQAGAVVTPSELSIQLWGSDTPDMLHRLRAHMSNLRAKIEVDPAHPCYILTDPGMGYRLRMPD